MSNLRCIIIEDEPLATLILEGYISQVPFLELAGKFPDAISAMVFLRDHMVDLMFLDIHLPRIKGMEFLKTLADPPAVIITTAYHQYAVEGFEMNVVDYLLKPFDLQRFLVAVNKVKTQVSNTGGGAATEKDHFFVNVQMKKTKIMFADILYIESQKEYVRIVTMNGTYTTKLSTHQVEELLPSQLFKRVHRSFIVAIDKVQSLTSGMLEINGVSIPVGRAYKSVLEHFL